MKIYLVLILTVLIFSSTSARSFAGWLIYHKPEFKGRVVDAETKEPIEGAVIVVVYRKQAIRIGPESVSIDIDVREAHTDRDGTFRIPSYTTLIDPFSWSKEVDFIIYKPGYGSFPHMRAYPPRGLHTSFEEFFSDDVGSVKEAWFSEPWKVGAESKKIEVMFGVVELPKLKTKEERLRAIPGGPTDYRSKKLPLLYKAINEERKRFGLGVVGEY